MAARVPAKSILKPQPKQPKVTDEQKLKVATDRKNLNLALQHAYAIQQQKDVQSRILDSIQALTELPSTASPPAPAEVTRFTHLVAQFQPSDLDDLIEERQIDGRCGYVLCSNPPRSVTLGTSADWKVGSRGKAFCSTTCAKKSTYVKSQLSETPAWERVPGQQPRIQLHESDRAVLAPSTAASDAIAASRKQEELALERGEKAASLRPKQVIADSIVEKPQTTFKPLSSMQGAKVSSTAIEGYEPRQVGKREGNLSRRDDDDDDDDEDADVEEFEDGD